MEEIVKEAIEKRSDSISFLSESRDLAVEDMEFELGGEYAWDQEVWESRGKRPKITINTATTKKNRLANDLRDLNPEIKIIAIGDDNEEKARIRSGLIKKIQDQSGAESIYDSCFSQGLSAGFSFMKVRTDYVNEETFDMTPKIEFIRNNMGVHIDPYTKSPCYLDVKWGLCENKIKKEEFESKYDSSIDSFPSDDVNIEGGIITADYYKIKEVKKKLLLLSNGEQVIEGFKDSAVIEQALEYEISGEKVWTVLQERDSYVPKLHWYLLSGSDILDEREQLGRYVPIIPYEGRVLWIQGKKYIVSFIRNLKEPSRLKNYAKSIEVEQLAGSSLTDIMAPAESIAQYNDIWQNRNKTKYPFLPWDHVNKKGEPIPAPQQLTYNGPANQLQGLFQGYNADIDEISGMYSDNIGGPSQLRAGVAIDLKQSQGNQNNFDFLDNFTTRTLPYLGAVLNDIIDNYYDTEREETIQGKDGKPETIKLNTSDGVDISGKYEVKVSIGSATDSKRKESNDFMMELARVFPEKMQSLAHIYANNLEGMKDKDDAVKLLKAQLGPELSAILDEDDPQRVFVENSQLKQQMEQQGQELEQAMELIKSMQIDYKKAMDVAQLRSQTDLQKTQMTNQNRIQSEMIKADVAIQKQQMQNQVQPPQPGEEIDGYRYRGGNPAEQMNWEPLNG